MKRLGNFLHALANWILGHKIEYSPCVMSKGITVKPFGTRSILCGDCMNGVNRKCPMVRKKIVSK